MAQVSAIVLCGGQSRRFGGVDKTRAVLGGSSLLDRLLTGLPTDWPVVCVGPERPLSVLLDATLDAGPKPPRARTVVWAREDPPGGGPVAGIDAGLARVATPYVVLLAGDLPFAAEEAESLVAALRAAPATTDGVRALDEGGQEQPLLAAYRTARLRAAVPVGARDVGVRRTLAALSCATHPVPAHVARDVDTVADLARAAQTLGDSGDPS